MKVYKLLPYVEGKERFCIECNINEIYALAIATSFIERSEFATSLDEYIMRKLREGINSTLDNN